MLDRWGRPPSPRDEALVRSGILLNTSLLHGYVEQHLVEALMVEALMAALLPVATPTLSRASKDGYPPPPPMG